MDLTIEQDFELGRVAAAMEAEAREWLGRCPVPVMVTAFDLEESRLWMQSVRPCGVFR